MIDLRASIDADTRRILDLANTHRLTTPVRTCGDWTLADLVWHLGEVQHFWAWVVATRATDPEGYEPPTRPADDGLVVLLDGSRAALVDALATVDPTTPCWSWSDDHTAGFTLRRQAHEALVHRIDAEMAVGTASAVDPELAADGVDEVLRTFLGDLPGWMTFQPEDEVVAIHAVDVDRRWTGRFGRAVGTSPVSGEVIDVEAFVVLEGATATTTIATTTVATTITATAAELDLWLWGRDRGDGLRTTGDPGVPLRLRELVVDATQ